MTLFTTGLTANDSIPLKTGKSTKVCTTLIPLRLPCPNSVPTMVNQRTPAKERMTTTTAPDMWESELAATRTAA